MSNGLKSPCGVLVWFGGGSFPAGGLGNAGDRELGDICRGDDCRVLVNGFPACWIGLKEVSSREGEIDPPLEFNAPLVFKSEVVGSRAGPRCDT